MDVVTRNRQTSSFIVVWVPKFDNAGQAVPSQKVEPLRQHLESTFGGWTSFAVKGGWPFSGQSHREEGELFLILVSSITEAQTEIAWIREYLILELGQLEVFIIAIPAADLGGLWNPSETGPQVRIRPDQVGDMPKP